MPDPTYFVNTGSGSGGGGWFDFGLDDLFGGLIALIALIMGVLVFWWVLLPLLLVILDAVIVVVLTVVGVIARVVLHRPWTLEAQAEDGRAFTREVTGWRNASAEIADITRGIQAGTSELLTLPR